MPRSRFVLKGDPIRYAACRAPSILISRDVRRKGTKQSVSDDGQRQRTRCTHLERSSPEQQPCHLGLICPPHRRESSWRRLNHWEATHDRCRLLARDFLGFELRYTFSWESKQQRIVSRRYIESTYTLAPKDAYFFAKSSPQPELAPMINSLSLAGLMRSVRFGGGGKAKGVRRSTAIIET